MPQVNNFIPKEPPRYFTSKNRLNFRNYDAELTAFQARIGEQFDGRMLRKAFVTQEYLESEYLSKKSLGIGDQAEESSSSSSESSESSDAEGDKQLSSGK